MDGPRLHHVREGDGPPLVLLHGFPQDCSQWRRMTPRLAERYTVVAVDLRGVGGSDAPPDGYDMRTLAADVAGLLDALGLAPAHVVGHDIGGMVAYALARLHPVRTVTIVEVPLPGLEPPDPPEITVPLWHGEFHMVPGLPETLVAGHQEEYFRYFFDTGTVDHATIGPEELARYAAAYADPASLHAAFEMYRAIPAFAGFVASATEPVDVPLLLVGGEQVFGPYMAALAPLLRERHGWSDVRSAIVPDGRHYLPDEFPDELAELVERHAR
ncbi:alpha/beta hydrolase [Pseudonocardia ailaonensis]|uniref:Alpha/beta hydrolase n=1 Tax=Pseudonocardia ailaonensis TaxID=367279 RepID=A0ABN2NT19_9PSEU